MFGRAQKAAARQASGLNQSELEVQMREMGSASAAAGTGMQVDEEANNSIIGDRSGYGMAEHLAQNLINPFAAARQEETKQVTSLSSFFFSEPSQDEKRAETGIDLFSLAE